MDDGWWKSFTEDTVFKSHRKYGFWIVIDQANVGCVKEDGTS